MAKKPKNGKVSGRCAFCGGGNLSKEHFWSEWTAPLVKTPDAVGPYKEGFIGGHGPSWIPLRRKIRERPGHVVTKKIRAVCVACNSEWMSKLEEATKVIASPLILGKPVDITPDMQETLAKWISLKVMVGEQNQRHHENEEIVVLREDRRAFKDNLTIPGYFRIWIARCVGYHWRHMYLRHSTFMANPLFIPDDTRGKNTQSTAIGIGELFTYTFVCRAHRVGFDDIMEFSDAMIPLWPLPGRTIKWPPPLAIDDRLAHGMALALEGFMRRPGHIWLP